jgi:hypothetical protein
MLFLLRHLHGPDRPSILDNLEELALQVHSCPARRSRIAPVLGGSARCLEVDLSRSFGSAAAAVVPDASNDIPGRAALAGAARWVLGG